MEKIKSLGPTIASSEESVEMQQLSSLIQADIQAFKVDKWLDWCVLVSQTSEGQLKKPLLL